MFRKTKIKMRRAVTFTGHVLQYTVSIKVMPCWATVSDNYLNNVKGKYQDSLNELNYHVTQNKQYIIKILQCSISIKIVKL